ncbi:MAG: hypothetical protein DRI71_04595 [Bacteroidetes bacterium]|nr:MAG: hypothetical protein DRI71_04595 [Bacteroidota bacterium]
MKKSKKYSSKKGKKKVKERVVSYQESILDSLYGMSYEDIEKINLPGKSLTTIQQQTSLGAMDLAQVMGVSKSTYYNLLDEETLDSETIDAMVDFAVLWQKGLEAFDEDASLLNEWLETRNTNLGGIKPIELLATRVGRRALEKAFLRIEYSTYG